MRREDLPIFELENSIVETLRTHSRLIIQAPTGSGKSTQVPQILFDHGLLGDGQVVILQPRRLATRLLASRVATERQSRLGDEVGYQIRFENVTSPRTRIRFVTEGILLRQLIQDPELRGISAILFDEFHERHLYGDITLARALTLQATSRPDLKLAVMSATLDAGALEKYLAPCSILTSAGRAFPVDIEYLPRPAGGDGYPIWDLAADELERLAPQTDGDVLIFMPGKYEIGRTISAVRASRVSDRFVVLPLHGELPPAEQDAALAHYEKRRAIVATNVAETSLTIDGVQVVIDSGLARIARFDPRRGINTLLVEKISRASADQRAGRAGRTAPGRCLRLWTEREHLDRTPQELPEVKRLDLAEVVLTLKASGVDDIAAFRWLEPPDPQALARAEQLLVDLGAIAEGKITPLGQRMLAFPVHPRYARMLLAAQEHHCVPAIALIAALTQGRNLLRRLEGKQAREDRDDVLGGETESDFFILMRAFRYAERSGFDSRRCARLGINAGAAREAAQLTEQFLSIARDEKLDLQTGETKPGAIPRCVLAGFPDQVAVRLDAGTLRCALVHGRRGVLARESAVRDASLLVASEIREIESSDKERQVLLTLATKIEEEWLRELFPESFREERCVEFDPALRRVIGRRLTQFHDLVLGSEEFPAKDDPAAAQILAREVLAGTCPLKNWDNAVEQWIARANFIAAEFPELEFPTIGEAEKRLLLEQLCQGASSYKEIKDKSVMPVVKSWLNPGQQQALDDLAPERIGLASGRNAKITYADNAAPTIAARIQDLYDTPRGLTVGRGRIPLRIQVLAPNNRPIQITNDLETFWREGYPKIKKELQRKYPKHKWR
ncbi:MAG TPA: ATP-dependent helicase HrpB [Chthoniobacterales bacterium]|nr:ATP-dependent helicase HrpB [Chthoniobacterales bacterium]